MDTSVGLVDPVEVIVARLGVSDETLRLVAKRFTDTGGDVHATIGRKKAPGTPVPSPVTGEVEARLIALACSARYRGMGWLDASRPRWGSVCCGGAQFELLVSRRGRVRGPR